MTVFERARWLPLTMLGVSAVGFMDATYLAVKHFTHTVVPCSILHGCEVVTTSVYSTVLGIPVALMGSLYYLALIILLFVAVDTKNEKIFLIATRSTALGLFASGWFVYVQAGILQAFCQWCMLSAITSITLFVLGYIVTPRILKVV